MRTLIFILGSSLWGLVVFVVAMHLHFPEKALLERLSFAVQEASEGGWALESTAASPWRLTGVALEDVTLFKVEKPKRTRRLRRGANATDEEPDDGAVSQTASPLITLEHARARLALLPLITGKRTVVFDAGLMGGKLAGEFGLGSSSRHIEFDGEDLNLAMLPIGGDSWSVDAVGAMALRGDMDIKDEALRESTGELHLSIDSFAIRSARMMGIDLTPMKFTEAAFDINIANGKAEIAKGVLNGDLLDATFSGYATLNKQDMSRWRVRVEVKLELDATLDQFAKFSPDLKDARDSQGVYHLICTGVVARPTCNADRNAAGTQKSASRRSPRATTSMDDGGEEDVQVGASLSGGERPNAVGIASDEDREERRKKRLERIRERRDRLRQERKAQDEGEDFDEVMDEGPAPPGFMGPAGNGRNLRVPPGMGPGEPFEDFIDPNGPDGLDGDPMLPDDLPMDEPGFDDGEPY